MPLSEIDKSLFDEYGSLERELFPWKIKLRRLEDLAKIIRARYQDSDPEASIDCAGDLYRLTLGPASMQSSIPSILDVYKALGKKKFLSACTITMKALEALHPSLLARLTVKARTGWRPIIVTPLPSAEPAKKAV